MDEKRVREAAANMAKFEKMKKELMDEHEKNIAGNEHLMDQDPETMTKEEREKLQKMVVATQEIQNKLINSAVAFNLLFTEELQNRLKTVYDSELDGRRLFPKNTAIQFARFQVKLIHVEE